jgi:hypothetical protein
MKTMRTTSRTKLPNTPSAFRNTAIHLLAVGLIAATTSLLAQPDDAPILPSHPGGPASISDLESGSGGGSGTAGSAAKPAPNPPPSPLATFSGSAYTIGAKRAPSSSGPEAEEHIAVAPNDSNILVAGISDYSSTRVVNGKTGNNTTKYAMSWDSGNSWFEAFVPLDSNGFPLTTDGYSWEANSDPVVAIDASGHVYLADLYFNITDSANGLYINVGDLSGAPLSAGVLVAANYAPNASSLEDKPWIAVDSSSASPYKGRLYVSWTRFTSTSDIYFATSDDRGGHWTAPLILNPSTQSGRLQGSQLAVGPDGTVYAVWYAAPSQAQQFLAKSTDGGQSFSAAVAITPPFNLPTFTSSYRKNPWPALAVDPRPGYRNVYVIYADQPNSTLGAEIEFVASLNGGPFTAPVRINDNSTGQQFMPALAVDGQGTVHCSWFDTRNSLDGTAEHFDIYATYTANGGATFAPNTRVTSTTINVVDCPWPPRLNSRFIGDYAGMAASGGYGHPAWTGGSLETATLLLPGVRDFSLVAGPSACSVAPGAVASFTVSVAGYGGFTGPVNLSVNGLPADAVWSFSGSSINGTGSSTLTISSATLGHYDLTIVGTSGGMTRTSTVELDVDNPDFTLSVSPTSADVSSSGGAASYTVSIGRVGGFTDTVNLSVGGLALGASATFNPPSATASATMTVTVAAGTSAGSYTLTLTGAASSDPLLVHTTTSTLVVAAAPSAVYVVQPSGATGYSVSGGKNNTSNLTVTVALVNDFGGPVAGASVSITLYLNGASYGSATATTGADSTVSFVTRSAPAGTYMTQVTSVSATGLTWDGKTPGNSYMKTN